MNNAELNKKVLIKRNLRKNNIPFRDDMTIEEFIRLEKLIPEICDSCEGKGYIEVTHDDDCEYIDACQECAVFAEGSMGDWTNADQNARDKAVKDGYKLNKQGKIMVYK